MFRKRPFYLLPFLTLELCPLSYNRLKYPRDCDTNILWLETNCYDIICIMKFMNFLSSILIANDE